MAASPSPLVELHAHVGGCLRADDLLELILAREVDWTGYEAAFARAYGRPTPLHEILAAARAGDPAARRRFRELFVFDDERAGDFDRFSASFSLIGCALPLRTPDGERALVDDVRFVAERIAADCRARGVAACELRFYLGPARVPAARRALYRALLDALARASRDGVELTLAPSLPREAAWEAWTLTR